MWVKTLELAGAAAPQTQRQNTARISDELRWFPGIFTSGRLGKIFHRVPAKFGHSTCAKNISSQQSRQRQAERAHQFLDHLAKEAIACLSKQMCQPLYLCHEETHHRSKRGSRHISMVSVAKLFSVSTKDTRLESALSHKVDMQRRIVVNEPIRNGIGKCGNCYKLLKGSMSMLAQPLRWKTKLS